MIGNDDWLESIKSGICSRRPTKPPTLIFFLDYYDVSDPCRERLVVDQIDYDAWSQYNWDESEWLSWWSESRYGEVVHDRIEVKHKYNLKRMRGLTKILSGIEYRDMEAITNVLINAISAIPHQKHVLYSRRREPIVGNNISTYRVRNAVDHLIDEGYLTGTNGVRSAIASLRRPSSYTPTHRLIDAVHEGGSIINTSVGMVNNEETSIILRGNDKKDRPIPRSKRYLIDEMTKINTSNANFVLKLDGRILNTNGVRIFNENMEMGGRIYRSDVLRLESSERLRIEVNDMRLCEVDFISMHPRILFNMKNIHVPIDAYSIMFDGEYGKSDRDLIKTALNIVINSGSRKQAVGVLAHMMKRSDSDLYTCPDHLLDELYKAFHQISEYFLTGIGRKLQKMDSDVAISVMLRMGELGKLCVGCHDSFLTERVDMNILMSIMDEAYRDKFAHKAPMMSNIMVGDIKISEVYEI